VQTSVAVVWRPTVSVVQQVIVSDARSQKLCLQVGRRWGVLADYAGQHSGRIVSHRLPNYVVQTKFTGNFQGRKLFPLQVKQTCNTDKSAALRDRMELIVS